ncbi:MAG: enoyl-CoA hydratase/isomerase family protein [Candidatus Thorarchaeota archaeon]
MNYEQIQVIKNDNVGKIILNSGKLNILNIAMMVEINRAIEEFSKDNSLKALVVGHTGRTFSAGVDVGEHMGDTAKTMLEEFHKIFRQFYSLPCPTIASVKGAALGGGCEVALFCDFVIASENAKFGQPEIKVGVFPPLATVLLPHLVPLKMAYELVMHGESMNAQEALKYGLINHVFPSTTFDQDFENYLQRFRSLSAVVLRYAKKALQIGTHVEFMHILSRIEHLYLHELMETKDANEGLQAFVEKRSPVWQNR